MGTFAKASIWCTIMGLFAKGTSGLGKESVKGLKRVPNPAAMLRTICEGCCGGAITSD
jgi:hypothetical protein